MSRQFIRARVIQNIIGGVVFASCISPAHAQDDKDFAFYLENSRFTASEKKVIEQKVIKGMKDLNTTGIVELKQLQGNYSTSAFCVSGYAKSADYTFSTKDIAITRERPIGCTRPGQCRGIQADVAPNDLIKPYDFSMRLECSDEDTIPRRSKSELSVTFPSIK